MSAVAAEAGQPFNTNKPLFVYCIQPSSPTKNISLVRWPVSATEEKKLIRL